MNNIPEYTVTQLNHTIKNLLEQKFEYIKLVGEAGPITIANSGHVYFSIKENDEVISCICWKGSYERLEIKIEEGAEFSFFGRVTSFSKFGRSVYQLIVDQVEYSGAGSILKLIEERKKLLTEQGFFDNKNKLQLPKFPLKIGILTSASGSVIHDIIHRISQRFPITHLYLFPITVQGKNTHQEIIEYLDLIESNSSKNLIKPDLIIFARGGGSLEELMPFNDPDLIKRVFILKIPSISAIGHETDYTLLDLVCDLRAPTPSAAAELSVPDMNYLLNDLQEKRELLNNLINKKLSMPEKNLLNFKISISALLQKINLTDKYLTTFINKNLNTISQQIYEKLNKSNNFYLLILKFSPISKINLIRDRINSNLINNKLIILNKFKLVSSKINLLMRIIKNSSLENNLKKGYAILKSNNSVIKNIKKLESLQIFTVVLKDGSTDIKK